MKNYIKNQDLSGRSARKIITTHTRGKESFPIYQTTIQYIEQ